MRDDRALLSVEADGLLRLQADLRLTGIVARFAGETYDHMCVRIADEYGAPLSDVKIELERFQ